MGGTSFDVSVIVGGIPTMTREAKVGEYPTGVTSIEVLSLGAGGGSIGWVDSAGLLHVGPKSAGAEPGPACYGTGGKEPTVTDANIVLGYIDPNYFLGGRMKLYPELSRKAIEEKIAKPLKQKVEVAASGIYRVVNENMVGGILEMTVRRGIDPREFLLIVGGGAGAIHGAKLARELNMRKLVVPKTAPVLCAIGMLNADVTFSYVGSKYTDTTNFDFNGVNAMLAELEAKAKAALDREGIPKNERRFEYYIAARYPMQVNEIDVPLRNSRITPDSVSQLVQDFHAAHKKRYAVDDPTSHIECTDWRVLGIGVTPRLLLAELPYAGEDASVALKGRQKAYFEEAGGFIETPVYDGNRLGYGMRIDGPAIIEDSLTTTVVIPYSKAKVNKAGSYIIELD
jgi:N-methylhydantoinase A